MSRVLDPLLRLKTHQRRQATQVLRAAEAERDRVVGRLEEIQASVARHREAVDGADGGELVAWAAWRLQSELAHRRESTLLAQRSREVELAAGKHRRDVMDELALGAVIQARAEIEVQEDKRAEARTMDEIAGRRAAVAPRSRRT